MKSCNTDNCQNGWLILHAECHICMLRERLAASFVYIVIEMRQMNLAKEQSKNKSCMLSF
jgi:hypothetical protein